MSEIDVDALLPNDRVKQSVLAGDITQLTRGASTHYAEEGDTFHLDDQPFTVTAVLDRTLGDFTDRDAQREGSDSLDAYKQRMKRVHPGDFEWDDTAEVRTYRFQRAE